MHTILDLIGNQPMVKLQRLAQDVPVEIWVKLEYFNPSGSIKDRIALYMLEEAEKRGEINPNTTIIEPTSGNTGISFAMVSAVTGYKFIAVMPEAVSLERRKSMQLLGAKVELIKCVDKEKGVTETDLVNTINRAKELRQTIPDSYMPNQFENIDNPEIHSKTTATEILKQTQGKFHAFVAAVGTGGTFSGISKVLKQKYPTIKTIAVEPATSAVLSGNKPGFHKIEGIGEGFIPKVMDVNLADQIIQVTSEEAMQTTRLLWSKEGIMGGISSGANVAAALKLGKTMNAEEIIVTIIPDSGFRYFSTDLLKI
jgi:cysteine synthase A